MTDINLDYFFENLFSDKFDNKEKLNILAELEANSQLHLWIGNYHPKYYIEHIKNPRQKVMGINLAKDLGLW